MKLEHIPYITLWAVKFDEMVVFYRDKLALPIEYSDENFIQFATQGTKLYIHRLGDFWQLLHERRVRRVGTFQ